MRTKLREYILRSYRTSGMITYDAKNGSFNMSGFGKPFNIADLPERLQRQIREGATPRLAADPVHGRALIPPAALKPPRGKRGPITHP